MTQKEFKERVLSIHYKLVGDKIIVDKKNGIDLNSLKSLPPNIIFENSGGIWLKLVTSIPRSVEFNNRGDVYLESLVGGWFFEWRGNIKGIFPKDLLNKMISDGVFDRK
jgi:hypothetical protein